MKALKSILTALLCFLALFQDLEAQPFMIRGEIVYGTDSPVYLAAWEKDRFSVIDSVESGRGPFVFLLPEDTPPGVFRLFYDELAEGVLSTDRFVELIYNMEDLVVYIDRNELGPLPRFESSMENAVYRQFVDYQMGYEADLSAVYRRMYIPPDQMDDSAREAELDHYEALQENRLQFMDSLTALYPGLYAIRIMNAFRVPVIPGHLSHSRRMDTLKRVFFQLAPVDDPALLQAPVYTFRIVDFLSIFQDSRLDSRQQEEAFMEATDLVMANVGEDPELRSFVVNFLLEGFELLGMERVQIHLADHYLDEQCTTDVEELVRERMEGYRAMQVGQLAPDLLVRDSEGRLHQLSELPAAKVLVFFWATTCPHCMQMMPELVKWYREDNPGVEVVSVSIDSSAVNYTSFLEDFPLPWISVRDPLGWNGSLADAYHIYATPSMFLLDEDRRIISRPVNMRQFIKAVRKLED